MNVEPRFMTPEEVLHVLRLSAQYDPPYVQHDSRMMTVTFETTLLEFNDIREAEIELESALAGFCFGLSYQDDRDAFLLREAEMREILARPAVRTVGDLCHVLSELLHRTSLVPFSIANRPCKSGAIFLTLRGLLAERGISVRDLWPSTPLRLSWDLVIEAVRIAPQHMAFRERSRLLKFLMLPHLLGCGMLLVMIALAILGLGQVLALAVSLAVVMLCTAAAYSPAQYRFPGIVTYRDLCKTLAGEPVARPNKAAS